MKSKQILIKDLWDSNEFYLRSISADSNNDGDDGVNILYYCSIHISECVFVSFSFYSLWTEIYVIHSF